MATPKPEAAPKAKNHRAQVIGNLALKNRPTAEEAAKYVNESSYVGQGYRARHKDVVKPGDLGPCDWAGKAKDQKWLIIHADKDNKAASTPK